MFTKAEEQFLELYRSGIWEKPVKEEIFDGSTDWDHKRFDVGTNCHWNMYQCYQ